MDDGVRGRPGPTYRAAANLGVRVRHGILAGICGEGAAVMRARGKRRKRTGLPCGPGWSARRRFVRAALGRNGSGPGERWAGRVQRRKHCGKKWAESAGLGRGRGLDCGDGLGRCWVEFGFGFLFYFFFSSISNSNKV